MASTTSNSINTEYVEDMLAYWRVAENKVIVNPSYMLRQSDINPKMREILIDWMVEVQVKFKLKEESLLLAVNILDRFLEQRLVSRGKLQLVGCTSLIIASKYEEIFSPYVSDFVAISDKAYIHEQLIAMESG